ncbi:MAG: o-succinylbenzoate synthase [Paramuribaculum sp.]|nr:o-succinylbenzoate synthase [Paramuribaculum sp.]
MLTKPTYFIKVWDEAYPDVYGVGECGLFPGLSCDDVPDYEERLSLALIDPEGTDLNAYPSIRMGLTTALRDLAGGGHRIPWDSYWTRTGEGIPINGLIWMGSKEQMAERIREKIADRFRCIKLKIGGIDFNQEIELLRYLRGLFPSDQLEIRLDANGAFSPDNALARLEALSWFDIHSIEQPIRQGQWAQMAHVCKESPIPVALDEELIGVNDPELRRQMIEFIHPRYVILKPTLCGGFEGADHWIELAEASGIGWWATSALESNIGLNAIAQWVAAKGIPAMVQGLGTGNLYLNNIPSPIYLRGDRLYYNQEGKWQLPTI